MKTLVNGSAPPQDAEELGKLYDEEYYKTGCGPVPYARSEPQWSSFFGSVADNLIRAFHPKRVLDAGCALGFLVEAFWDRGVEAWGIDISPYAIAQVRRDMQAYCTVASLSEGIPGSYDLITCIEVVEHMPESQSLSAISHMTKATDVILFSSTPYDMDEPTHFNVRPLVYWLQAFRDQGFAPDLDFDATFVCTHAILFRRSETPLADEVLRLYSNFLHKRQDLVLREGRIHSLECEKAAVQSEKAVLQSENTALQSEKLARPSEETLIAPYQERIRALEAEIEATAELQDKVRAELELATHEIEQLAGTGGRGPVPSAPAAGSPHSEELLELIGASLRSQNTSLKAMEFRLGAMEQQNAHLAAGLNSILDSKIWRTLVRGGGALQKLLRF